MTNFNIVNAVKQITDLNESELNTIFSRFQHMDIKKRSIVLKADSTAKEVYIILEGCMRLYYEKDGVDISAYFFTENMFAGAYDSFITQKPSRHFIEAVEDCRVLVISHKAFQELYIAFPKMNEFVRKVIEERFVSLHALFTSYILDSPEERYLHLLKERPDLLNRIPQHQIATFLGITPVSLSRIRNRVAKK
ncbi:Crp/Fnr family transcriptional regulator [Parasediminibacterium paludis]|uniref:Crp/Fnr family transcriptional regulator n=1 Tax=Parasediminibacterium paludis TaxID=908966 RepID=A0ABV8PVB3_9BACT